MTRPVNIQRVIAVATRSIPFLRIYTYQDPAVLQGLYATGYLSGNHGQSFMPGPYRWMRSQMEARLETFSGDLPVWAWLRSWARWDMRLNTERLVRITAVVPTSRILLSNFSAWNTVLNKGYLSIDEAEDDAFEAELLTADERIKRIRESWPRIFDPAVLPSRFWQACIDRIYMHEIVSIRDVNPPPQRYRVSHFVPDESYDQDWQEGWFPPPDMDMAGR